MIWRRRDLRRKQTTSEAILWNELRNNKLGYKFKRQYSIVNYVVHFYCHKVKLAIELDGHIHIKTIEYDRYRSEYLKSLGITELRYNNDELVSNIRLVLEKITNCLPFPEIRRGTEGEVK